LWDDSRSRSELESFTNSDLRDYISSSFISNNSYNHFLSFFASSIVVMKLSICSEFKSFSCSCLGLDCSFSSSPILSCKFSQYNFIYCSAQMCPQMSASYFDNSLSYSSICAELLEPIVENFLPSEHSEATDFS